MSTNIIFDDGIKEYTINNDPNRVIRVNTSDYAIVERFEQAEKNIREFIDKINPESEEENLAVLASIKDFIYEQIDFIFNAKVADAVFNGANPLSTVGGVMLYEKFLEIFLPIIEKDLGEEVKKSTKRMEKYNKPATAYKKKTGK